MLAGPGLERISIKRPQQAYQVLLLAPWGRKRRTKFGRWRRNVHLVPLAAMHAALEKKPTVALGLKAQVIATSPCVYNGLTEWPVATAPRRGAYTSMSVLRRWFRGPNSCREKALHEPPRKHAGD